MPLTTQNSPATCSGLPGSRGVTGCWTPWLRSTSHLLQKPSFGHCLDHFYDAFALERKANLRQAAQAQYQLEDAELTSDLRLTASAVARKGWGRHSEQPNAPPARSTRRNRVPPGVITLVEGEEEAAIPDEESSEYTTDSEDSSSESEATQVDSARTPLMEDITQYDLMQAAYTEVGRHFQGTKDWCLYHIQVLETVPRRWPLARFTIPLQRCVDYLDRLLAGCCWEVFITRRTPAESVGSLRSVAKSLTILLTGTLAEFLAESFRGVLAHASATLVDEETKHLLSANYWLKPIYQELLHAASSHNASPEGERKRPCSGLVKVIAHQRQYPGRGRDDHTARVSDWIGGHCPADTLMVWFPAHWMPLVLKGMEERGKLFRQQKTLSGLMVSYRRTFTSCSKRPCRAVGSNFAVDRIRITLFLCLRYHCEWTGWLSMLRATSSSCRTFGVGSLVVFTRPRLLPHGAGIDQKVFRCRHVCPTIEILIPGLILCMRSPLAGQTSQTWALITRSKSGLVILIRYVMNWE